MGKDVSIIIINYKTSDLLVGCLKSLLKYCQELNFETIVIDNNSKDSSLETIKINFPQVKLIRNKKNAGFAWANNQGAKIAQGKILFFLNPDTLIKENIFQKISKIFKQDPEVGIVAPRLVLPNGQSQLYAYGRKQTLSDLIFSKFRTPLDTKSRILYVDWVSGAALAIRPSIFKKIGGFDEKFFMYFEDRDLCHRTKELGYKVVVLADIKVVHFGGRSLEKNKERKKLYYQSQNYYWAKHYGYLSLILMRLIRWPYKFYILYIKK